MEMRIPNWARAVIGVSTLMQLVFAVTLFIDPARIADTWPWPLPPLSARLLGASTLVSVPMAFLVIYVNRFAAAMIPLVMMITYRVLQLVAGLIHIDRFKGFSLTTLNYFGGGILMMAVFGYVLWAGLAGRLPNTAENAPWPSKREWRAEPWLAWVLRVAAVAYVVLGLFFLFAGGRAAPLWIDAGGLTPLSARLFSSPLIGLGLGLYLCARADDWRSVAVPAVGMVTIGFAGTLSLFLDRETFLLSTPLAGLVAATPAILFAIGLAILVARPRATLAAAG